MKTYGKELHTVSARCLKCGWTGTFCANLKDPEHKARIDAAHCMARLGLCKGELEIVTLRKIS